MHFQCYIHAPLTRPLVIINTLICHLNKLEVVGFIYYILVAKQLRTCARARALLFVHMRVRRHARALSIPMPLPSTCSSLRLIHAELPRIRSALGGQTRRADGGLLLLLLIPRGSIHHSPPASVKQSGIPLVLGRGCASGLESVPGTITRRGAPLYLPLSPCPHRGNNHTG